MMEEVSIAAAYDAHIISQTTEEDLLASLVADSKLRAALPNQKQKEKKRKDLFHRESQPLTVEKYKRENQLLQQASIRLEQENDILAHELLTSKILLRKHLDQAEDKAEQLSQELLEARKQLLESTLEVQVQEEETTTVKDAFRTQLDESESRRNKSLAIMAEYKQICSQLSSRLETEGVQAKTELEILKRQAGECEQCRGIFDEVGELRGEADLDLETGALQSRQKALELELAQAKMQLVEAQCRIQDLEHQQGALKSEFNSTQNWFSKALSTLKPAPMHH